jgi:hypothetical protein
LAPESISEKSPNFPYGKKQLSHCGGGEHVAAATRRRRRILQAGIFLLGYAVCQFVSNEPKAGANDIIADKKVPCQFFFLECVLQKSHKKVLP